MSRVLIATWDGAGNLVPTLGLAARLAARGHDVRVLGHRAIDARCGRHGWRFRAFARTPDVDSAAPRPGPDDMAAMARRLWFNPAVAADVAEELAREDADVLIGDCMLWGALSAGAAAGVTTAALFHGAITPFRRGPFADLLATQVPSLNEMRGALGLRAVERASDVHDACELSLVAAPREFEPAWSFPANVRFMGPLLDAPPPSTHVDAIKTASGAAPLVAVSFSTGDQGHRAVLQRVVDALALVEARVVVTTGPAVDPSTIRGGDNTEIVRFVPHGRLLPHASLVVTHAGLGTVMTALAHGRPLLCIPLGRDQMFNAARVDALGAGRTLPAVSDVGTIASMAQALLADVAVRDAAARAAGVIAGYHGGGAAIAELEGVAERAQV